MSAGQMGDRKRNALPFAGWGEPIVAEPVAGLVGMQASELPMNEREGREEAFEMLACRSPGEGAIRYEVLSF